MTTDNMTPEFYSTREAAVKLGLSLGTVQKMVETGALSARKTRRVLASSLNDYMRSRQSGPKVVPSQSLSILVLEDDDDMRAHYKGQVAEWGIDVNLHLEPSGLNALLHIAKHRPDIVITDLNMANLDGFDMITSLRRDQSFAGTDIVVVTTMSKEEIVSRGTLPKDVMIFAKPVSFATLQGYVKAKEAAKVRAQ